MKKILFLLLCCLPLVAEAQTAQEQKIIQKIGQVAAQIKTIQCNFVQTKNLKMLNDKLVSKGKMYYQQSNRLRWEYQSPYTYTFILNDTKVLLKKGNRNDVIDVNQNKIFKEIARIMMNSVVGKCLTDKSEFKVSLVEKGNEYVATLLPQKKDMKQMFTKILLHFNKQKSMVSEVDMYEKNGDFTEIVLQNVVTDKAISAQIFSVQ